MPGVKRVKRVRFTVELDSDDYELLETLSKELGVRKSEIVRSAIRYYFANYITFLHVHELKIFFDFVRAKLRERSEET